MNASSRAVGRLREYARRRSALDAAEAFDLVRAEQLKIYVSFGFVSLYEYMERVLGYRPYTARERMRVARALAALPETTAALARGALSYSAVRELTRVATAESEADWLAQAEGLVALVRSIRDQPDNDAPVLRLLALYERDIVLRRDVLRAGMKPWIFRYARKQLSQYAAAALARSPYDRRYATTGGSAACNALTASCTHRFRQSLCAP